MLCAMIRRLACGTMLTTVALAFTFGRAVRPRPGGREFRREAGRAVEMEPQGPAQILRQGCHARAARPDSQDSRGVSPEARRLEGEDERVEEPDGGPDQGVQREDRGGFDARAEEANRGNGGKGQGEGPREERAEEGRRRVGQARRCPPKSPPTRPPTPRRKRSRRNRRRDPTRARSASKGKRWNLSASETIRVRPSSSIESLFSRASQPRACITVSRGSSGTALRSWPRSSAHFPKALQTVPAVSPI